MLPPNYRDRVYAGWLGKCAGVRLGVPVENWTAERIARQLGEIRAFFPLPPGTVFQPDDDTAFPLVLIEALAAHGPSVGAQQIGDTVLNLLAEERGTLWWGGYGRSTEHTAYRNLAHGIPAPLSGSAALNGQWLAEQIGGQIFSDIWGLVAPCNPGLAADLAARASSVTHDGAGIDGGRFVAALVSHAFAAADPLALIDAGLAQVNPDGAYAGVIRAVRQHHQTQPTDWRACLQMLDEQFGPALGGGPVHIIPNAGVVALAVLYSGGDFGRAITIATMAGWDTDCNAGNVGAIMGVALGLDGIGAEWRAPMNDQLVAASVIGSRNLTTIPRCANHFARLGTQVAGEEAPPAMPRFCFDFPGSTHGFEATATQAHTITLQQVTGDNFCGRGALQATLRSLNKKAEAQMYVNTYLRPAQLSANNYGASFSPALYPGQIIQARVFLPPDAPAGLLAAPFAWDDNAQQLHQPPASKLLPGTASTLRWRVPPMHDALLSRAGLVFGTTGHPWSGAVLLDWLDWTGVPQFACSFGREQPEFGAISGWTVAHGYWRLERGAYHGSGVSFSESYTGEPAWLDLRLSVDLVPLLGDQHHVLLRVQGTRHAYVVGLAANDRLVVYKNQGGYHQVVSAPLAWRQHQRLRITITAQNATIMVGVDGRELVRWQDQNQPYLAGQIGLGNGPGCHTRFERVAVEGIEHESS